MATWTEEEFVGRAKTLAKAHAGSKTSINDLVEKVAREAELTPDGIRTLGRLTNVAVFQELFQKKATEAATDRMVEFEPGDPEVVIGRVVESARIQADAVKSSAERADVVGEHFPDLMRAERAPAEGEFKQAGDVTADAEREAPKPLEIMRLRKVAAELDVGAQAASIRWQEGMEKLSRAFKKAPGYGPSYLDFEKAALAEHGLDARHELAALRAELRLPTITVSQSKVASLAEKYAYEDTPELRLFSDVLTQREQYQTLTVARINVMGRLSEI